MHYPWWYVPYLTAPMLIAVISVVHVLVSHYAVGGGLFLAVETGHAHRTRDREYLDYLRGHARFFVLLTVVFGAITGRGHLVDHRADLAAGHRNAHPHLRLRLGHRMGLLRPGISLGLHLPLLLGPAAREDARHHRLDLRHGRVDQPGADYRHHGVHAQLGRLGLSIRLRKLLGGVFQSAVSAADDRPDRRCAAAEFALCVSARLADDPQRRGCAT